MKAAVRTRYGSPDVLEVRELDAPEVGEGQVLVRVHASSVNAHDWHVVRGTPYFARVEMGLRRPKDIRLGLDIAGVVEAVGPGVTDLRVGDRVFGSRFGAHAELVAARQVVPMPANLTFAEAAAIPTAGQTALQGLRDKGGLRAGQRVLIVGAGGGVGTMAVQIARALGAEVTAVTRTAHVELVRSLGAADVIDYTRTDVTRAAGRFDVILDIAGTMPLSRLGRLLADGGTLVMVAPDPGRWIGLLTRMAAAVVRSRLGSRRFRPFLAHVSRDDLLVLKELVEAGQLRPVVTATYPLERVADAIRCVDEGRASGKVVVTMDATG
jgi:NADPH:quinone reductase-like Zn-dependent oxidoreductase